jgi:hypothetical protein
LPVYIGILRAGREIPSSSYSYELILKGWQAPGCGKAFLEFSAVTDPGKK